jgi:hypothetical protein
LSSERHTTHATYPRAPSPRGPQDTPFAVRQTLLLTRVLLGVATGSGLTYGLFLLTAAVTTLGLMLLTAAGETRPEGLLLVADGLGGGATVLAATLIATTLFRGELDARTALPTLAAPVSRAVFLASRALGIGALTLAVAGLGGLIAAGFVAATGGGGPAITKALTDAVHHGLSGLIAGMAALLFGTFAGRLSTVGYALGLSTVFALAGSLRTAIDSPYYADSPRLVAIARAAVRALPDTGFLATTGLPMAVAYGLSIAATLWLVAYALFARKDLH